jgi:hypothetical protein
MFSVLGKTLCEPCGDKALSARGSQPVPEGAICRHADPTVCGQCGMDNGDAELATVVAGVPVCGPCAYTLRHRPFPLWVKLAFLTFLVLAVVDFGINWRLFQAYFEIPGSRRAFEEGKIERAAELMDRAASHVPEYRELRDEATFMKGIVLRCHWWRTSATSATMRRSSTTPRS